MKKNIVIIGSGYSGLVAALKLAEKGHKITVLEKSNNIGGLASGFTIEGESLEKAYHHIFKTDTDIINLSESLGIKNKIIWKDSSVSLYFNGHMYPFKGALDLIKFKPLSFINRLRAGLVVLYLQKTNNWKRFENITAYNWMLKASGKEVTRVIWEPLLKGKFDKYYDKVSMAWLWARIHIRAQSREAGGEKLGYFEGGFQIFTDALLDKLKNYDVKIITDVNIVDIKSMKSKKIKINYSNGKSDIFDTCIATIPSYALAGLIGKNVDHKYINQLNSIDYLGARLLIFSSTQNLSPYYWHNINDLELPFLVFINHTNLIDKKYYNGKYIYYIATYVTHDHLLFKCSDKEIEKLWLDNLRTIFPKFNKNKIREKHFFRFANAQHIVTNNYRKKIPKHMTPIENLYLTNFSQIYPEDRGTNYAVKKGLEISELVIKDYHKKNT